MKSAFRILFFLVGIYVVYRIAMFVFIFVVFTMARPSQPSAFVDNLSTNMATYSLVDSVEYENFGLYAYDFDRNKYANALPNAAAKTNVTDSDGNFPAFKLDEDIFVITAKGRGTSSGLAISDESGFKQKIEKIDESFQVQHVRDNIYTWYLRLE